MNYLRSDLKFNSHHVGWIIQDLKRQVALGGWISSTNPTKKKGKKHVVLGIPLLILLKKTTHLVYDINSSMPIHSIFPDPSSSNAGEVPPVFPA